MSAQPADPAPAERRSRGASEPSGRLLLRMPRSLHAALAQVAERDGTSLNQLITGTLASAIGWSGDGVVPAAPAATPDRSESRTLLLVLVANAVAVGLAAVAAIALLLYAWLG